MRLLIFLALVISAVSLAFAFPLASKSDHINFLDYSAGAERKQAFIAYLKPIIEEKNQSLINDRQKLIRLSQKTKLNIREQRWLKHISHNYNNDSFNTNDSSHWSALLDKVDIIPVSLALAQSAKESGWGASRFASTANNYFGQWCYRAGCGLVPKMRSHGANHEVARYESAKESVAAYINNLNTNPAYKNLRDIREQLRKADEIITGYRLANGLQHYSERGQIYVEEVQALIRNIESDALKTSG